MKYKDIETRSKSANKNKTSVEPTSIFMNTNSNSQTNIPINNNKNNKQTQINIINNVNQSIHDLKSKLLKEDEHQQRVSSVKSNKNTKQNAEKLIEDIQVKINNLISSNGNSQVNFNKDHKRYMKNIENNENSCIYSYTNTLINDNKESKRKFDFSSNVLSNNQNKYFKDLKEYNHNDETTKPGRIYRINRNENEKDVLIKSLTNQMKLIKRNYPFDINCDKIILHKGYLINENNQFALISDASSKEYAWVNVTFTENSKLHRHMKEIPNLKQIESEYLQQKQIISMLKSQLTCNNSSINNNTQLERIKNENEQLVKENRLKSEEVLWLNEKISKMAVETSKQISTIFEFQSQLSLMSEENSKLVCKIVEMNRKIENTFISNWRKEMFMIVDNKKIDYFSNTNRHSQKYNFSIDYYQFSIDKQSNTKEIIENKNREKYLNEQISELNKKITNKCQEKEVEIMKLTNENSELKSKINEISEKTKSQENQINELVMKALENSNKDLYLHEIIIKQQEMEMKLVECENLINFYKKDNSDLKEKENSLMLQVNYLKDVSKKEENKRNERKDYENDIINDEYNENLNINKEIAVDDGEKNKKVLIKDELPSSNQEENSINDDEKGKLSFQISNLTQIIYDKDLLIETLQNEINLLKASQFENNDEEEIEKLRGIIKSIVIYQDNSDFLEKYIKMLEESMVKIENHDGLLTILHEYLSFLYKIHENLTF